MQPPTSMWTGAFSMDNWAGRGVPNLLLLSQAFDRVAPVGDCMRFWDDSWLLWLWSIWLILCGMEVTGVILFAAKLLLLLLPRAETMPFDEEMDEADDGMGECGGEFWLSLRWWLLTVFCCLELESKFERIRMVKWIKWEKSLRVKANKKKLRLLTVYSYSGVLDWLYW